MAGGASPQTPDRKSINDSLFSVEGDKAPTTPGTHWKISIDSVRKRLKVSETKVSELTEQLASERAKNAVLSEKVEQKNAELESMKQVIAAMESSTRATREAYEDRIRTYEDQLRKSESALTSRRDELSEERAALKRQERDMMKRTEALQRSAEAANLQTSIMQSAAKSRAGSRAGTPSFGGGYSPSVGEEFEGTRRAITFTGNGPAQTPANGMVRDETPQKSDVGNMVFSHLGSARKSGKDRQKKKEGVGSIVTIVAKNGALDDRRSMVVPGTFEELLKAAGQIIQVNAMRVFKPGRSSEGSLHTEIQISDLSQIRDGDILYIDGPPRKRLSEASQGIFNPTDTQSPGAPPVMTPSRVLDTSNSSIKPRASRDDEDPSPLKRRKYTDEDEILETSHRRSPKSASPSMRGYDDSNMSKAGRAMISGSKSPRQFTRLTWKGIHGDNVFANVGGPITSGDEIFAAVAAVEGREGYKTNIYLKCEDEDGRSFMEKVVHGMDYHVGDEAGLNVKYIELDSSPEIVKGLKNSMSGLAIGNSKAASPVREPNQVKPISPVSRVAGEGFRSPGRKQARGVDSTEPQSQDRDKRVSEREPDFKRSRTREPPKREKSPEVMAAEFIASEEIASRTATEVETYKKKVDDVVMEWCEDITNSHADEVRKWKSHTDNLREEAASLKEELDSVKSAIVVDPGVVIHAPRHSPSPSRSQGDPGHSSKRPLDSSLAVSSPLDGKTDFGSPPVEPNVNANETINLTLSHGKSSASKRSPTSLQDELTWLVETSPTNVDDRIEERRRKDREHQENAKKKAPDRFVSPLLLRNPDAPGVEHYQNRPWAKIPAEVDEVRESSPKLSRQGSASPSRLLPSQSQPPAHAPHPSFQTPQRTAARQLPATKTLSGIPNFDQEPQSSSRKNGPIYSQEPSTVRPRYLNPGGPGQVAPSPRQPGKTPDYRTSLATGRRDPSVEDFLRGVSPDGDDEPANTRKRLASTPSRSQRGNGSDSPGPRGADILPLSQVLGRNRQTPVKQSSGDVQESEEKSKKRANPQAVDRLHSGLPSAYPPSVTPAKKASMRPDRSPARNTNTPTRQAGSLRKTGLARAAAETPPRARATTRASNAAGSSRRAPSPQVTARMMASQTRASPVPFSELSRNSKATPSSRPYSIPPPPPPAWEDDIPPPPPPPMDDDDDDVPPPPPYSPAVPR